MNRNDAYIICTTEYEYHLIVDGMFMYSCDSLPDALVDLVCFYYVLNIQYPKSMYPLYMFLQHFIFGLKDSAKIPNSVISLYSILK